MTAEEISARIIKRIDDDPTSPGSVTPDPSGHPVPPEVLAAINEGQELASLLTLCIETTATFTLPASTPFNSMRSNFTDFLVPLRMMAGGVRIRPATLADLDAENENWQQVAGPPSRYFTLGFNFWGVTPQPAVDTTVTLTYAAAPTQLVFDDFPQLPEEYHQSLVKYGIYRVKLKEGAQGLQRGLTYLNDFLDDMDRLGSFVRARSAAARYDVLPFELRLMDRSRLIDNIVKEQSQWGTK